MTNRAMLMALITICGIGGSTFVLGGTSSKTKKPIEIGRFFFSPAERAQQTAWRKNKVDPVTITHVAPQIPTTETPATKLSPKPSSVTFKGLISRNHAPPNIWLQDDDETVTASATQRRLESDQSLRLSRERTALKVGQRYSRSTLSVDEAFHAESKQKTLVIQKSRRDN